MSLCGWYDVVTASGCSSKDVGGKLTASRCIASSHARLQLLAIDFHAS